MSAVNHYQRKLEIARCSEQRSFLQKKLDLLVNKPSLWSIEALSKKSSTRLEFLESLWPFPQPLNLLVASEILKESRYKRIFDRVELISQQSGLFTGIKEEIRKERLEASEFDPNTSDTLGWRGWNWDHEKLSLISPLQRTIWDGPELRENNWDDVHSVRGHRGIHARLVPKNWKIAIWAGVDAPHSQITGIVERFGKFVLGELGWRAEWVVIRKLLAPTQEIGFQLERAYPEVDVQFYEHEKYGDYNGHWKSR